MVRFKARWSLGVVGCLVGASYALLPASAAAVPAVPAPGGPYAFVTEDDDPQAKRIGPGPVPVDEFHPDRDKPVRRRRGGTVSLLLPFEVSILSLPLNNSSAARAILYEIHETLIQRDWETWEFQPTLAESWDEEDSLFLEEGTRLFGTLTDDGDAWLVRTKNVGSDAPIRVPKSRVERVERKTVLTFHLREGIRWHDGHPFDADDVIFSWSIYQNEHVKCDAHRSTYAKIKRAERLDDHTVRFFYDEQYCRYLDAFQSFIPLPSHLFNLHDADHAAHDPEADPEAWAEAINTNPHNEDFVGLGPYRLTTVTSKLYEAERFEDYFDPDRAGYVDKIRWRHVSGWDSAFQALVNGELDFSAWMTGDMYFGARTQSEAFKESFYKGHYYLGLVTYTPWNMLRPHLSDARVRKALAHAFDMEKYKGEKAYGLAMVLTGTHPHFSPAYDQSVKPLAYDPDKASELLAEAGWYDRDGDGTIDKDGVPFLLTYLAGAGNSTDIDFAQRMQNQYAKVGIKVEVETLDFRSVRERVKNREFDAAGFSWTLPLMTDQRQLWHSENVREGLQSNNRSGVRDARVDELIEAAERELDDEKRHALWRELHRYLYDDLQPYLYRITTPRKFAMKKSIRGFQTFALPPGYSVRRWYFAD